MRIRSVCSVIIKSLTCVGLMVAFYAMAGDVCLAQRVVKVAESVTAPFVACVEVCDNQTCVSDCIENERIPVGYLLPGRTPLGASLVECFSEAMENVNTCGQLFLVPIEDASMDKFWICEAMATMRFTLCPAFESSSDPETTVKLGKYCLELTTRVAENTIAKAQAGNLNQRVSRRQVVLRNADAQDSKESYVNQQVRRSAQLILQSFGGCAEQFASDRVTCRTLFPGDDDRSQEGLKDCDEVAKGAFKDCVKVKKIKEQQG